MQRIFLPIALIIMVLVGAWLIWPQPEPRGPAMPRPASSEVPPTRPAASGAPVDSAPTGAERQDAVQPTEPTRKATQLTVLCLARADQRPLAGVHVRATGSPELLSDADGRAVFEVAPGIAFAVSADDLEHDVSLETAEVQALAPGETRELRLLHDAGQNAHFCALVVAREGGAPIQGVEVRVGDELRTKSDAAGRFELDFAGFRPPALRLDAAGFGPAVVGAGPGHESADQARRIELERAASLRIALQVPEGQSALRVELTARAYELSQDQSFTTSTFQTEPLHWRAQADSQWIASFEGLPPRVRLDADVVGAGGVLFRCAEPLVLEPGEQRKLEWDLRGCELVGHAREADGKLAAQVTFWLLRAEPGWRAYVANHQADDVLGRATSGADGTFRFASVSPGVWLLAPQPQALAPGSAPEDAIAPVPLEITIRAGETRSEVEVRIARGLYVRGRLVAPDGTTGVQGYVYGHAASGESLHRDTDAQGQFALGPLAPGEFSLEGSPYNTYLSSEPVTAEAGARDVVLRSRPGAEVAGRVVDGQSGAGVQAAITVGGEDGSMTITRTQADGSFRFDGLAPGSYTLSASTSAGQAGELAGVLLDPSAPVTGLQLQLKPGARLRIRYEGSGVGQALVRRGRARIGGDGVEGGRSTLEVVLAGKLAVEFRYPGVESPEVREVELAPGEERELVFKEPAK